MNLVVQTKSINSFNNRLDKVWSNQAIIDICEAYFNIGTGTVQLSIDADEDLIKNRSIRTILRYLKVTYVATLNDNINKTSRV